MAATRLAVELMAMIRRPEHAVITKTLEGVESQVFKSKFEAWDDVLAVDFTRTAENVSKKGADLKVSCCEDVKRNETSFAFCSESFTRKRNENESDGIVQKSTRVAIASSSAGGDGRLEHFPPSAVFDVRLREQEIRQIARRRTR